MTLQGTRIHFSKHEICETRKYDVRASSPDEKWTRKENEIFAHKLKI